MITDRIENAGTYGSLSHNLQAALQWLQASDLSALPEGKVEVDGDRIFVLVQSPTLKPRAQAKWEAHRKYIDIHSVIRGEEGICYANLHNVTVGEYEEGRDYVPITGDGSFLTLRPGEFIILMPQDAHATTLAVEESSSIRKIVMKVAV